MDEDEEEEEEEKVEEKKEKKEKVEEEERTVKWTRAGRRKGRKKSVETLEDACTRLTDAVGCPKGPGTAHRTWQDGPCLVLLPCPSV